MAAPQFLSLELSQELSTVAAPPLQPPGAAPQGWPISPGNLKPGRTSHLNPWAQCRGKGEKNPPIP
uniref:Uncharacterized protein n=1 Tax=Trichinella nativa TaxID=6335 RepID=A0A0V1KIK8_9BILA